MLRSLPRVQTQRRLFHHVPQRRLSGHRRVIAIESSCDDTSVAIVDYCRNRNGWLPLKCLFHAKVTANTDEYAGIHPIVALESHQANLAPLVQRALNISADKTPDYVAVARGPGMRSNLSVGIDTAKGLATAWRVPLIGVHHMQAHALTPRLMSLMSAHGEPDAPRELAPAFPFLSLLASGGHSLLINTAGLVDHHVLAETRDIAIGSCIDKSARAILPQQHLKTPFGRALETFAFGSETENRQNVDNDGPTASYGYVAPTNRAEEMSARPTSWDWSFRPPLSESKGSAKSTRRMMYTFGGLLSSVQRLMRERGDASLAERRDMARELQRVAFEHLASRILLFLASNPEYPGRTVVVSGGVASNQYLRHILRSFLDTRGYGHIELCFPPIELCTDNALMIAWAGIEMYEAGYRSSLDISPIRTWSMDIHSEDGGILGAPGWSKEETPTI